MKLLLFSRNVALSMQRYAWEYQRQTIKIFKIFQLTLLTCIGAALYPTQDGIQFEMVIWYDYNVPFPCSKQSEQCGMPACWKYCDAFLSASSFRGLIHHHYFFLFSTLFLSSLFFFSSISVMPMLWTELYNEDFFFFAHPILSESLI